jgi:hypothetical protein
MCAAKSFTVEVRRVIQTAPYETATIAVSQTFDLEEGQELKKVRNSAYNELAKTVKAMADLERTRYTQVVEK